MNKCMHDECSHDDGDDAHRQGLTESQRLTSEDETDEKSARICGDETLARRRGRKRNG